MEKKQCLILGFKDVDDHTVNLKISDPKPDLTEEQVKTAMESIIEKNVFESQNGDLKTIVTASIVTTTEDTLV
ncbi:MAG: DUF2922 domain-containing protein [Tissierellales bacterium]|jgi:ABC-type transport system substrate-binding protein|nr:DUF2922 domain-containing protein [Tissierellales bacterium]